MERKRSNRRRRRGRLSFLWKPVCFVVVIVAVIAAITLFFRMDHIVVTGEERYTEQEILDASGLELGSNLYFINKFEVKEKLFVRLPYIEEIRVNRKLPDTLVIEVRECGAEAAVPDGNGFWLISGNGKLLEFTDVPPETCVVLEGAQLNGATAGTQADFGEEYAYRAEMALKLLREAASRGMRERITRIDLSDGTALSMDYYHRFTVRLPWTSNIGYKLDTLSTVVNYLENNETGHIDLMTEGKASFIPD